MNKLIISVLLLAATAAYAQDVDPMRLKGRWGGMVTQDKMSYTAAMQIDKLAENEVSGTARYPELLPPCETTLTLIHLSEGAFKFSETPKGKSTKSCIPSMVTITMEDKDRIRMTWTAGKNPQVAATATLTRITPVEAK